MSVSTLPAVWWIKVCCCCCCFGLGAGQALSPSQQQQQKQHPPEMCRSKDKLLERSIFELNSCAWCFQYMARHPHIRAELYGPFLRVINNVTSSLQAGERLRPNVTNEDDVKLICSTLTPAKCEEWKECCLAARECCQRQISGGPIQNGTCPRTWDGWSCWKDAPPGTSEYVSCPDFMQYAVRSSYAEKLCQPNGTWYSRYKPGRNGTPGRWVQWTDYTSCIDKQKLLTSIHLALGCSAFSVLFLIPALVIFLAYRSLRRQHRIRLHINFFSALLFVSLISILWDVIVTRDRLTSDSANTMPVLLANGVGCRLLAFLQLYFKCTTYVWMFCEGIYLHRLISNAFRPPKSLVVLYTVGWGVPLGYSLLYAILRAVYADHSCWAKNFGNFEMLTYCPNFLCLVINLFLLCNILRVLLTQLQTHPNEPSNFRRALKATFVLIPLFGIQLFVTMYRMPVGQPGAAEYEQFTLFCTNSQGFFVALIFCFFNGEVFAQVKRTCTRLNLLRPGGSDVTSRGTTLATSLHGHRDEDSEYPGGVNGSLLPHNGLGGPTNHSAGGRTSTALKKHSNNGNHNVESNRNYSYIPMKTMSSNNSHSAVGDSGITSV